MSGAAPARSPPVSIPLGQCSPPAAWRHCLQDRALPPSDVYFVDIGANVGWFTHNVAAMGYSVVAFEPTTPNALAIRQTMCDVPLLHSRISLVNKVRGKRREEGASGTANPFAVVDLELPGRQHRWSASQEQGADDLAGYHCRAWEKRSSAAACLRMQPTSATATSTATPTHRCQRGEAAASIAGSPHTPAPTTLPAQTRPRPPHSMHASQECGAW